MLPLKPNRKPEPMSAIADTIKTTLITDVEVDYLLHPGCDATYYDPPEPETVELLAVRVGGADILSKLNAEARGDLEDRILTSAQKQDKANE